MSRRSTSGAVSVGAATQAGYRPPAHATAVPAVHAGLDTGSPTDGPPRTPSYPDCTDRDDFYGQLTLDLGLHKLSTKVAWADRCIARIEKRIREAGHEHVA